MIRKSANPVNRMAVALNGIAAAEYGRRARGMEQRRERSRSGACIASHAGAGDRRQASLRIAVRRRNRDGRRGYTGCDCHLQLRRARRRKAARSPGAPSFVTAVASGLRRSDRI